MHMKIYYSIVSKGDATNFTHWEELKSTWKFVDAIQDEMEYG